MIFNVQNYIFPKDETPLAIQANAEYLFEGSCGTNHAYVVTTKRYLATRDRVHL